MKSFRCKVELLGIREVNGPLGVDTMSECARVVFVSALQKGSTTRICKLPVETLQIADVGLYVSGNFRYAIEDLIFCHIDQKNRRLVVLVVRRKSVDSAVSGYLDALVWRVESVQDADDLYKTFHEVRQRHKLGRVGRRNPERKIEDSASVSSDSAIESGSCDEGSGSGSGSSDECSYDSELSNDKESDAATKPRSISVPAARILMELIDKNAMEHKEVVVGDSEPEGRSRPRERLQRSNAAVDIEDIVRKLIPKDVRQQRRRRDSSLPDRSSPGIVSFTTTGHGSAIISNSTRCVFDPRQLSRGVRRSPAAATTLYHPVGTLDYKHWQRHIAGLDCASANHKSTLARLMCALRRPLTSLARSHSVSRSHAGSAAAAARGSDGQLRSVMKKSSDDSTILCNGGEASGLQFGIIEGAGGSSQDKKNVTFNALTRVQVVDCM